MSWTVPDDATGTTARSAQCGNCPASSRRTSSASVATSSACILTRVTGPSPTRLTPHGERIPVADSFQTVSAGAGDTAGMTHALNMITLGVRDVARSRAFYEALGWQGTQGNDGDPVFFAARGFVVALWDRQALAKDS